MEVWVLILTIWALYRWVHSRIQRQKEDERFANVIGALNRLEPRLNDLKKLESRVQELEQRLAASTPPSATPTSAAPSPTPPSPKPADLPPPVSLPASREIPKPAPPPPAKPSVPPVAPEPAQHPLAPRPSFPTLSPPPKPAPISAREFGSQLEETLGKNWLNKLGIIALVIGISLFLAYKFPSLSNPAKIGLGYFVSFLILGTGVYLERSDRYRVFARALIGGGWALTFFVTYAMHFVPYTRVMDTQWADLILLFLVAVAMVVHTLRYDSQVVTGLAFLLAFTTVAISQNTIYSLSAGAILALGLVAIVHRHQWFELEVFGILASYLNHLIWLAKIIVPMAGHHRTFPEFVPSTVLLCLYWATYRWSYIERRIQNNGQEIVSTFAAILNASFLLFLFRYQSVRPELAFYGLLVLGAVELTLGQLPRTRQRRTAFVILSTIGIILLVAAIPFKYSGMDTAVIWLAEAQMLLLAGVFTREVLFRGFGLLLALLTSGDMLVNQALPTLYDRLGQARFDVFGGFLQVAPAPNSQLAISFLVAGLLFYANSLVIPRRWKELFTSENEHIVFRALSYLASFMLFVSLWLAFPGDWTGILWGAFAAALATIGFHAELEDLSWQAHLLVLAGFGRTLVLNIDATREWHGFTFRFLTFTSMAVLLYFCAYFSGPRDSDFARLLSALDTWAGSILIAVLAFKEISSPWIAVAWAVFALLLLIIGDRVKRRQLHFQAYLLSVSALVQIVSVNLDAEAPFRLFPSISLRLVTVSLVTVLFYLCARWAAMGEFALAPVAGAVYTWAASSFVLALIYFELSRYVVALAWALFGVLLFEIGVNRKSRNFRAQSYVVLGLSFVRLAFFNLAASLQLLQATLPIAFLYYYVYLRLLRLSIGQPSTKYSVAEQEVHAGTVLAYLGSGTLVLFANSYFQHGRILVAWAALSFCFIAVAWEAQLNIFLYHSLVVALLVSFRALFFEFTAAAHPGMPWNLTRGFYVSAVAAILFAAQAFAFPLRKRFADALRKSSSASDVEPWTLLRRPEQMYFFLPMLLVTVLILNEVSFDRVTIAWGIEAVVAFLFALIVGERSFRLAGLGLLLICVAKIGLLDVWRQHGSDRYVTLIILGVALLLVSYLYTRYSEAIRRYL